MLKNVSGPRFGDEKIRLPEKLDKRTVEALPIPEHASVVYYDGDHAKAVPGFGLRVTSRGVRAWIVNYRTRSGTERRYTLGRYPSWQGPAARDEAKRLKRDIDQGGDPLGDEREARDAPTVADLCERYIEEHLPRKRPSSQRDDLSMIRLEVLPKLGKKKVAEVSFSDIDALHRQITRGKGRRPAPHRANRTVALLSKMFQLAVRWQLRADNPAKGIERNSEEPRERFLSADELVRLTDALAKFPDQSAANAIRLLLLTGARKGEVLSAQWSQFDLAGGVWSKPSSHTKQKRTHVVPLSPPALALLTEMKSKSEGSPYLFPGNGAPHRVDLKKPWPAILKAAKIENLRMHDLRHSFASFAIAGGATLPMIGRLLGHTQVSTTSRYSHLESDPLREIATRVGAIVDGAGKLGAEIVPMPTKGRGA